MARNTLGANMRSNRPPIPPAPSQAVEICTIDAPPCGETVNVVTALEPARRSSSATTPIRRRMTTWPSSPPGVDAVAISTPADTHVPLVLEAVSLGLPLVCDKPFALQPAAARQALEAAKRAGVPLTVYQNRRFDADLLTVRAVIDSGEVERVTRFESRIEQYTPPGGIPSSGGGSCSTWARTSSTRR